MEFYIEKLLRLSYWNITDCNKIVRKSLLSPIVKIISFQYNIIRKIFIVHFIIWKTNLAIFLGMFNTPGMQSLLTQMTQNPQLIQNMLQAPYIQTMMQTMSANPEMAQQVSFYFLFLVNVVFQPKLLKCFVQSIQNS